MTAYWGMEAIGLAYHSVAERSTVLRVRQYEIRVRYSREQDEQLPCFNWCTFEAGLAALSSKSAAQQDAELDRR